jgi:hypothetical protein
VHTGGGPACCPLFRHAHSDQLQLYTDSCDAYHTRAAAFHCLPAPRNLRRPPTQSSNPPHTYPPLDLPSRMADSRAAEGVLQALEAAGAGRALREHPLLRHNACVFRAGEGALQVGGN